MKIPKTIIQTMKCKFDLMPNNMKESALTYKILKNFEYVYFDDMDMNNYMLSFSIKYENDFKDIYKYFNLLKPGAARADIFRYCYLYENGGFYADIDTVCINDFSNLLDTCNFMLMKSHMHDRFVQAIIASTPGHIFLYNSIKQFIYNIENNIIKDTLITTGPVCFTEGIKKYYNNECYSNIIKNEGNDFIMLTIKKDICYYKNNPYFKTKYNNYLKDCKKLNIKRYSEFNNII